METLNKISLFGLLGVLMFSLAVTADEIVPIKDQVTDSLVVKQNENAVLGKTQLRKRYEQLDRRTTLGKITDKRAYR